VADLQVEGVLVDGQLKAAPRGHPQNKRATTHVLALGQRRILLVESKKGEHEFLYEHLRGLEEKSKFKVESCTAVALPQDRAELNLFLSKYDCIILANTPAELFTEDQQEVIRSNTADQGCGLIMVGGPESFGAGGWAGTAVEKALPVDCDIKSMKVTGKGGLVLIFHASEIADGNMWQVKIGKLAVEKLSPIDMMGVLLWDFNRGGDGTSWHIPFQTIGGKKPAMIRQIDKMSPGDMPDCHHLHHGVRHLALGPGNRADASGGHRHRRQVPQRHQSQDSPGDLHQGGPQRQPIVDLRQEIHAQAGLRHWPGR
jgi:hypothetical protein